MNSNEQSIPLQQPHPEEQVSSSLDNKKTDFDVANYDIEELAAILKFEHIPLNEGKIKRRIIELKRKFINQSKYINFFEDAEKKLLKNLKMYNEPTWIECI